MEEVVAQAGNRKYSVQPTNRSVGIPAVVDSGTSLLMAPQEDFRILADLAGAFPGFHGRHWVVCDTTDHLPDIVFWIGGKKHVLKGNDMVTPIYIDEEHLYCTWDMISAWDEEVWFLGDVFMRSFYTVFNYGDQTVGFAPIAKKKKKGWVEWLLNSVALRPSFLALGQVRRLLSSGARQALADKHCGNKGGLHLFAPSYCLSSSY